MVVENCLAKCQQSSAMQNSRSRAYHMFERRHTIALQTAASHHTVWLDPRRYLPKKTNEHGRRHTWACTSWRHTTGWPSKETQIGLGRSGLAQKNWWHHTTAVPRQADKALTVSMSSISYQAASDGVTPKSCWLVFCYSSRRFFATQCGLATAQIFLASKLKRHMSILTKPKEDGVTPEPPWVSTT